ncbi:MAG: hypothetical protein ACFBSE_27005 [Prochloraceae cyanobacterium]
MSVIENARYQYNLHFSLIVNKNSELKLDIEKIDRKIALTLLNKNKAEDFSFFNAIYWGSPKANSLSSGARIDYVLKILK